MANCEHKNFKANVAVNRLTNEKGLVTSYSADIEIHCEQCMMPFQFVGLPNGLSPSYPTVSIEGTELRQPIKPIKL